MQGPNQRSLQEALDSSWFYSVKTTASPGSCLIFNSLHDVVNPPPRVLHAKQAQLEFEFLPESTCHGFKFKNSKLWAENTDHLVEDVNKHYVFFRIVDANPQRHKQVMGAPTAKFSGTSIAAALHLVW